MALMTWDDSFSVKIAQIDREHQKLVSLLNDLHAAMGTGKSKELLGKIFDELITYTVTHFATEEKLMTQHAYPDFAAHKIEHEKLTKQALELQASFKAGKAGVNFEVLNFLRDWLKTHILDSDKKYGPFLNSKGIH